MMAGAAFTNISRKPVKLLKVSDSITPPLFLLFFVLSGAELDVTVLREIGLVGAVYIIARVVGKISGCFLGAKLAKAEPVVQKYLGFTLIPQAGVAIGLSLAALRIMPDYGATIRAVILCATLIYELTGPLVTKFVLTKAGEIAEPEVLKSTSRPA
jgi:Kef-type K+ transport system membrane component KefB